MKSSWNLACSLNVNCILHPKLLILNQCFLPLHLNIGSSLLWWFRLNWNRSLSASILLVTKIHARCIYFVCVQFLAFVSLIVLSSLWYLHTWLFQFDEKHIFRTLIENWIYKTQCQSRLDICQKIYTTQFLGKKIYTLKVQKFRLLLLKKEMH